MRLPLRRTRRRSGERSTSHRCERSDHGARTKQMEADALAVPRAPVSESTAQTASPWVVAAIVAIFYTVLFGPGLVHNPHQFVSIGSKFLHQGSSSTVIKQSFPTKGKTGYDGQFYYFLALDPRHGKDYIESPGIVYSRIGYPITVRALSGGNASVIPYMMLLVNIAAAVGGTLAVAFLLRRRGLPPWLALVYGLFPGMIFAVLRDLTEPLAYCVAAAGLVLFDPRSRKRLLGSAALFGFALLTRETVALFPAVLAIALLVGAGTTVSGWRDRFRIGNVARAAAFAWIGFAPLFLWRHVVAIWLNTTSAQLQERPAAGPAGGFLYSLVPFHAYAGHWLHPSGEHAALFLTVVLPGLVWGAIALAVLLRTWTVEPWFVLANVAVFVVLLPTAVAVDYGSMGRAAIGIVLAILVSLPRVAAALPRRWPTVQRSLVLWSLPYYLVIVAMFAPLGAKLV